MDFNRGGQPHKHDLGRATRILPAVAQLQHTTGCPWRAVAALASSGRSSRLIRALVPSPHEARAAPSSWPLGPRVKREDVKFGIDAPACAGDWVEASEWRDMQREWIAGSGPGNDVDGEPLIQGFRPIRIRQTPEASW